eukprot:CAMPEP_0198707238 /NCGR_PEP_ID=MMETSP1468-20131203/391379_1 /TAXON_ID=1461545 /ORGANISM="Mantoniella sp, Strain CCMP1436" /LENGTH=215 /DNA_ID=CAMNT_0044466203 /DNA_START=485 /DNA_END=1132 /DNA_ORIENTATION=+
MVQILETAHFRNPSAHSSSRSSFGSFGSLEASKVSEAPAHRAQMECPLPASSFQYVSIDTRPQKKGSPWMVLCLTLVAPPQWYAAAPSYVAVLPTNVTSSITTSSMPVAERPAPRRCVILHDTPLDVRIPKPHRQRAAIPYVSPGQFQVVQGEVRGAIHVEDAAECGGVDGTHVAAAVRHVRAAATLADDGQPTKVPERRQGSTAEQDVRHQPDF